MSSPLSAKLQIAAGALVVYSLSGLYFYDLGKKSVKPIVKIETKTEQKIEYVDRVTTRMIKGDTVTEIVREKGKTETKVIEKEKHVKPQLSQYALSGYISFDPIRNERYWQAMAGFRLGELPVFLEVGRTFNEPETKYLGGFRYEF